MRGPGKLVHVISGEPLHRYDAMNKELYYLE
jgi:hypothetical protein